MRINRYVFMVFVGGALTQGCDLLVKEAVLSAPPVATVDIQPGSATLAADGSLQLVAQANDGEGQPVGGAAIQFHSKTPELISVTSQGLVRARGRIGTATVAVVADDKKKTVSVQVVPGRAYRLRRLGETTHTAEVMSAIVEPIRVRVSDTSDNGVPGVAVQFSCKEGGCKVDPPEAITNGRGIASVLWTLGKKAGAQVLTAKSNDPLMGSPALFSALARSAPAQQLKKRAPDEQNVVAGSDTTLELRVSDIHENPKPNIQVFWTCTSGGGKTKPTIATTDSSGVARTRLTTGPKVAVNKVVATVPMLPDAVVTFNITTRAGKPTRLETVRGAKQRGRAGRPVSKRPAARARDAHGNPVPRTLVRFEVSAGRGLVEPEVALTDDKGIATVDRWLLGDPGPNVLTASAAIGAASTVFSAEARGTR